MARLQGHIPSASTERSSTAPWTRPTNEFVVSYGMFTAAEFAMIARRHMHKYGTSPESLAYIAATIRNNGHVNPEAVYYGRGPFTPQDIPAGIVASLVVRDAFLWCLQGPVRCAERKVGEERLVRGPGQVSEQLVSEIIR